MDAETIATAFELLRLHEQKHQLTSCSLDASTKRIITMIAHVYDKPASLSDDKAPSWAADQASFDKHLQTFAKTLVLAAMKRTTSPTQTVKEEDGGANQAPTRAQITGIVRDVLRNTQPAAPPPPPPPPPPPQFDPHELGFFDPFLSPSHGPGETVVLEKGLYYRSIYLFCERIKDLAHIKGDEVVRLNVSLCLRGAALQWYISDLSVLERSALRCSSAAWIQALSNRWKTGLPPNVEAMDASISYTVNDARKREEPAAYIQYLLCFARHQHITDTFWILNRAWGGLDPAFRIDIPQPTSTTTVKEFITKVENKKQAWFYLYRPN